MKLTKRLLALLLITASFFCAVSCSLPNFDDAASLPQLSLEPIGESADNAGFSDSSAVPQATEWQAPDAIDSQSEAPAEPDTEQYTTPEYESESDDMPGSDTVQTISSVIAEDGYYYDLESVVLYLDTYGKLPRNFITKKTAGKLGWEGGPVDVYMEGAAIGGDVFGNRENLLPAADGRVYTECDIDTLGKRSRGAKRLVFSNDGLYFYTEDHYESFTELIVTEEGKVMFP